MEDAGMKKHWDELWDKVRVRRDALEAGLRGGVSAQRRRELEDDFQAAHRQWWDAVSNFGSP